MVKVAMISKWHVHSGQYANEVKKNPNAEIVAVWDEETERGTKWAAELEVPFFADLDELLASDIDAVVIDSPTNMHYEIMKKCALAKKHIYTEKTMTLKLSECDEVSEIVKQNGLVFEISFPYRTSAINIFAKKVIEEGWLGPVRHMRVRNGHDGVSGNWLPKYWYDGEKAGGGAMMDLGCHPMYLASWLMGKPYRIQSMYNMPNGSLIDENAVSVAEFENKAIAIIETSFVSSSSPYMLELYGEKGTLLIRDGDVQITSRIKEEYKNGWHKLTDFGAGLPGAVDDFIDSIINKKPAQFGLADARGLVELLEGAYIAHESNKSYFFK